MNIPNPAYVLYEERLLKNLELLQYVQKASGAKILCALKGYAMWSSFALCKDYLSGATASSLNEAKLISEKWGDKAHLCAPVYLDEELSELFSITSHITFNSLRQHARFSQQALEAGVSVGLRVNPESSTVDTDLYNPCMPGSRLGIVAHDLQELPEGVEGLHFHALCEQGSEDLETVLEAVEEKFGHLLHQVKWVNFGGGHHITKEGYDVDLLIELIKNFRSNYQVEVILEPGEAIGWQTGDLIARVEDIIENNGIKTAMVNVSFTGHMPDCLEMPYKPAVKEEREEGKYLYRIGGLSCLSGDFVEGFRFDEPLKEGDVLTFQDMIHYTFVKSTMFNGVGHPALVQVNSNGEVVHLKEFDYSDYRDRLS